MRSQVVASASHWPVRASALIPICGMLGMILLIPVLGATTVWAQSADMSVYTIRAGDMLDIRVAGQEQWSMSVAVRPDGRITYPATGEIEVAGLTLAQLTEHLEHALGPGGRHLRSPNVIINVIGPRTPVAYVLGAVARSGAVELPTGVSTATKVLTMAGGANPGADLHRVHIYQDDGTRKTIDLAAQLDEGADVTSIRAGDVMMLSETQAHFVGVLGAVGRTGEVPLPPQQESIDVLELLVKVGGVGEKADEERAMILRDDGGVEMVDLAQVLSRDVEPPRLHSGEVLWVPTLPPDPEAEYFAVIGAVRSPGRFEHREGMTLADVLALSGQPGEAATPENVTIIRADGEKEIVDVRPLLYGQDTDIARILIQPDDIVLVPAQHKSYVVLGAVGQTGFFPWDEDTRLADAIARSGGLRPDAALERVALVRRADDGEPPTVLEIDARMLLQGGNEDANVALQPGDAVYVPHREEKSIQQRLAVPLTVLGIIQSLRWIFKW